MISLCLVMRAFGEGGVIATVRHTLNTMWLASGQLASFSTLVVVVLFFVTIVHINLFGVYTDQYDNPGLAFIVNFDAT
jgi:hypothetical protein